MGKDVSQMSLRELWQLFPVVLRDHDPRYRQWYRDEADDLRLVLGEQVARLGHIGSTAVPGLRAKPTVDLLLETDAVESGWLVAALCKRGWTVMHSQQDPYPEVCLNKGYTPQGFAERVYHLHVRRPGDWGELYFRDYLAAHPPVAAEYAALKTDLAGRYRHDRDGYTAAKTAFVTRITALARRAYPGRYLPAAPVAGGPVAVLFNPTAGGGRGRSLLPGTLATLRRAGRPVRMFDAGTREAALAACHRAVADGVAAIVALGGDGTAHLALQAVAGGRTALGIVPVGTGNDLAPGHGLPVDPVVAAETIAASLRGGAARRVDLARLERPDGKQLWFGSVLATGFDALVNDRANRMSFPRSHHRYQVAILAEVARLESRRYALRLDGADHEFDAVVVAVANTDRYGGGMRICPHADPVDGRLDVVVGRRMGRLALARLAPRLRRGTHLGHPLVWTGSARVVELAAAGITGYADGERTFDLPVTVRCVPGALTLLGG